MILIIALFKSKSMGLIQPTANEEFLMLRVEALEREVERLTKMLTPAARISEIDINDPVFLKPLSNG